MSKKVVQTQPFYLQAGIDGTQTSIVVSTITDIYGNQITTMPAGVDFFVATCEPRSPSNQESWKITAISDLGAGQSALTVVRMIEAQYPYAPLAGTVPHGNGSECIITNGGLIYEEFVAKDEDSTVTAIVTFTAPNYPRMDSVTPAPTDGEQLVTKDYVDNLVVAGAPDANTTTKGIVQEATQAQTDAKTGTGSTGARLFVNPVRQRSTNLSDYDADTGIVNAIAITPSPTISAYAIGQRFNTIVAVTNTGATTISVNGLAATPLMKLDGVTPLVAGDLVAGQAIEVEYDGVNFQLLTPVAVAPLTNQAAIFSESFVSGENLTANKPVYVSPFDSKLYTAHGFKETNTYATFTQPTTNASNRNNRLNSTQFLTLSYTGSTLTVSVYAYASPGSAVDTETVTASYDTDSVTSIRTGAAVARLSDSTFIIFYAKTTNSSLFFRTGSISGSTITLDTETAYTGAPDWCYAIEAIEGSTDGTVVLGYQKGTASFNTPGVTVTCVLAYLTCSTNTATVTYSASYNVVSGAYFATQEWTRVAFTRGIAYAVFNTTNSGGVYSISYSAIDTLSGTTTTQLSTVPQQEQNTGGTPAAYGLLLPYVVGHNSKIYFGWRVGVGMFGTNGFTSETVQECSFKGARVAYEHAFGTVTSVSASAALTLAGNEMGVFVGNLYNIGGLYIQKDNIYGFTPPAAISGAYSNAVDEIIITGATTIRVWKMPTFVDGYVLAGVTAPAAAPMYYNYITTSGLTASTKYFLKDTYTTVGDITTNGTIPVGNALSTTLIKLNN